MFKRKKDITFLLIVVLLFFMLSVLFNEWLSATMPRHQLIQLPALFLLGIILGNYFSSLKMNDTSLGIGALIFIMSSLIFWMLPHSIDYAVINKPFNRIMHWNMLFAGFLLRLVLRNMLFEIKILFLGMLSAMVLATGIALKVFDILLCSSFDIYQQKETGLYLIIAGFVLFIITFLFFFKPEKAPNRNKLNISKI
ncbi:MAG: hypothetical protein ABIW47_19035 [Ginsengibacter sp.]